MFIARLVFLICHPCVHELVFCLLRGQGALWCAIGIPAGRYSVPAGGGANRHLEGCRAALGRGHIHGWIFCTPESMSKSPAVVQSLCKRTGI
jgi:hypothetical protein